MHIFNRKKKLQTIYNFLLSITIIKIHRSGNVKTILYTNSTTITNSILCEQFELVQSFASHCCGSPRVYVSVSRIQCVLTLCTVLTLLSVTSCTDRPATWFFFLLRCTAKTERERKRVKRVWGERDSNHEIALLPRRELLLWLCNTLRLAIQFRDSISSCRM